MTQKTFCSFEELVFFMENWSSFEDNDVYDPNGIINLLGACLRNMDKYALDSDFECISDVLGDSEKILLRKISSLVQVGEDGGA